MITRDIRGYFVEVLMRLRYKPEQLARWEGDVSHGDLKYENIKQVLLFACH
jgi:hypothetical protein